MDFWCIGRVRSLPGRRFWKFPPDLRALFSLRCYLELRHQKLLNATALLKTKNKAFRLIIAIVRVRMHWQNMSSNV